MLSALGMSSSGQASHRLGASRPAAKVGAVISQAIAGSFAYQPRSAAPRRSASQPPANTPVQPPMKHHRGEKLPRANRSRPKLRSAPTGSRRRGRSRRASSRTRRRPAARNRLAREHRETWPSGAWPRRAARRIANEAQQDGASSSPATPMMKNAARQSSACGNIGANQRPASEDRSARRARRSPAPAPGARAGNNRRSARKRAQRRPPRRSRRPCRNRNRCQKPVAVPHKAVKALQNANAPRRRRLRLVRSARKAKRNAEHRIEQGEGGPLRSPELGVGEVEVGLDRLARMPRICRSRKLRM